MGAMASSRDSSALPSPLDSDLAAPAYRKASQVAGTSAATSTGGELLERLAGSLGRATTAAAVFGEPVTNGGVTVIPVASAKFGFGGGSGSGGEGAAFGEGGGGGGGATVTPVGFIAIGGGQATFTRIRDPWADVVLPATAAVVLSVGAAMARQFLRRAGGRRGK